MSAAVDSDGMDRTRSLWTRLAVGLLGASLLVGSAFLPTADADPLSPIVLDTVLSRPYDGQAPLPTIDPSTSNGEVATLDQVGQRFDVSVNTSDGAAHTLSSLTITATLTTAGDARWMKTTVSNHCSTVTVSPDGRTLVCTIDQTLQTGQTLAISAGWAPTTANADGTHVTVAFTATGVGTDVAHPEPSTSNSIDTVVRAVPQGAELRKRFSQNASILRNPDGTPLAARVPWGIELGVTGPSGNVKGASSIALGDVSLVDDFTGEGAIWANATLVGCKPNGGPDTGDGVNGNVPMSQPVPTYGPARTVENSGTWSCSQPGGPGTPIDVRATGIDWSPDHFPGRSENNGDNAALFEWNTDEPSEQWNTPADTNNHAIVAVQNIWIDIPWADVLAADQTASDTDTRVGFIQWWNKAGSLQVDGADTSYGDDPSDDRDWASVILGTGAGASKQYTLDGYEVGPESAIGLGPSYGRWPQADNFVAPRQKLYSTVRMSTDPSATAPTPDPQLCDAIDTRTQKFVHNDIDEPFYTSYDWYGVWITGTAPASVTPLVNDDVIVEFASSPTTTWESQRTVDCDDPSLMWVADPTAHPAGIDAVNLARVRLVGGRPIPPGQELKVDLPIQVGDGLAPNTMLVNMAQFKSGGWQQAEYFGGVAYEPDRLDHYGSSGNQLGDRAFVANAQLHIEKHDVVYGADTARTVAANSDWTYTLTGGLNWMSDLELPDVTFHDVLPPGMTFVSSSVTPSVVVQDCNADTNPTCRTNPAARTDVGYTSIEWHRGDYQFDVPSAWPVGVVSSQPDLFGTFTVTVHLAPWLPGTSSVQNRAWVTSDVSPFDTPVRQWRNDHYLRTEENNGPADDDWVIINQIIQFGVEKRVIDPVISTGGDARFDIVYGNTSSVPHPFDVIDVLPWNGDGRIPASAYHGTVGLVAVDTAAAPKVTDVWITGAPPATIDRDPNAVAVGTGIWTCRVADAGSGGCPSLDAVTAVRVVTADLDPSAVERVRLTMSTSGNRAGDTYTNNVFGRAGGLVLPVISEDVTAQVPCNRLGNLVFLDADRNGTFGAGDGGLDGVHVLIGDPGPDGEPGGGDDTVIESVVTGADGRWQSSCLPSGDYVVEIDPAELASGGNLEDYHAAPNGVDPVSTDDETVDHNAIETTTAGNTRIGTDVVHLSDAASPVGEPGDDVTIDRWHDFTVDLGLVAPLYTVGDLVWIDTDRDGVRAPTEVGIDGSRYPIHAVVYAAGDTDFASPLGESDVDSTGHWSVGELPAGEYVVRFVLPSSVAVTISDGQDPTADPLDSDVPSGSDVTAPFTLGPSTRDVDLGVVGSNSLGDLVWLDRNGDGVQNASVIGAPEAGAAGVTVRLLDDAGTVIATTTTNDSGSYLFDGLFDGDYSVEFVAPNGLSFPPAGQGGPPEDSNADPDTGRTATVSLSGGSHDTTIDAGLMGSLSLGDRVWYDADADGVQDPDEGEVDAARLKGHACAIALFENVPSGPQFYDLTFVGPDGRYAFHHLPAGDYFVALAVMDPSTGTVIPYDKVGLEVVFGSGDPLTDPLDGDAVSTFGLGGGTSAVSETFTLATSSLDVDFGLSDLGRPTTTTTTTLPTTTLPTTTVPGPSTSQAPSVASSGLVDPAALAFTGGRLGPLSVAGACLGLGLLFTIRPRRPKPSGTRERPAKR